MIGGCVQAFRETGFAMGIAIINLCQDLYMNKHWTGPIPPYNPNDPNFILYRDEYFKSITLTDWIMAAVTFLSMGLGAASGFGNHEREKGCYPKNLKAEENSPLSPKTIVTE